MTSWYAWQHDLRLAAQYARRITQAFYGAIRRALRLIGQWLDGQLTLTFASLLDGIWQAIMDALWPVLQDLWRAAWHLGQRSAEAHTRVRPRHGATADDWIASQGRPLASGISRTGLGRVAQLISSGVRVTLPILTGVLRVAYRAPLIAMTEVSRAIGAAALANYMAAGITFKRWLCFPGCCQVCRDNADEGPIPLSAAWQDGSMGPPEHPHCRCAIIPA